MIKFYGTDLCADCLEAKEHFKNIGLEYEFIDITGHILNLKEFLILRDTRDEFKAYKEKGLVAIPTLLMEDGSLIIDEEVFNLK